MTQHAKRYRYARTCYDALQTERDRRLTCIEHLLGVADAVAVCEVDTDDVTVTVAEGKAVTDGVAE